MSRWSNAQTFTERLEAVRALAGTAFDEALAEKRGATWRSQPGLREVETFSKFLEVNGVTEQEWLSVLATPAAELFDEPPSWLTEVLKESELIALDLPADFPKDLLTPSRGLLDRAALRLREKLDALDLAALYKPLLFQLCARLVFLARRALVLEVNLQSVLGALEGETPEARYASFQAKLATHEGRLAFLEKFPVLARSLQTTCALWLEAAGEFVERLAADLPDLRLTFKLNDARVSSLVSNAGDSHAGGRTVHLVTFDDGKRIVYKPHPVSIDAHFYQLVDFLNENGLAPRLRKLGILDRGDYGWVEFVKHEACESESDVEMFYERQGCLLAIMHLLAATDMHFENIVAAGADPVAVDLETLFHPNTYSPAEGDAHGACRVRIRNSVMAVDLLPAPALSQDGKVVDPSGLGGEAGQGFQKKALAIEDFGKDTMRFARKSASVRETHNRPSRQSAPLAANVLEGFRKTYRLLMRLREDLGPRLDIFANDQSRILIRDTQHYASLLQDGTHPDHLRDNLDRARHWHHLWSVVSHHPIVMRFLPSELTQLEAGDVPFFTTSPGSTSVHGADGTEVKNYIARPSLEAVKERLASLSEADLCKQEWFIRASLGYSKDSNRGPRAESLSAKDPWLAIAEDAGRDVLKELVHTGDAASFLSIFSLTDEHGSEKSAYSIRPAERGIYDGAGGVALFLAHLAEETQKPEFKTAAEDLVRHILKTEEKLPSASLGAFSGRASLVYLFSHLGALWDRADLLQRARELSFTLVELIEVDRIFDVVSGTAGAVLALLSLGTIDEKALELAKAGGDHLLRDHDGSRSWELAPFRRGFSHGASGISHALARLSQITGEDKYREGALEAAAYEQELLRDGNWTDQHSYQGVHQCSWCHGAPGIAIARHSLGEAKGRDAALAEVRLRLWSESQCLCHGVLGNLEPLLLMGEKIESRIEEKLLAAFKIDGWRSARANQTLGLGLMTGLAGIGFGLLRLRNPEKVPSLLSLAPPVSRP